MSAIRKIVDITEEEERAVFGILTVMSAYKRTVTRTVAEFVGLTQSQALSQTATGGFVISNRKPSGNVFWVVTEEKTEYGSWTPITGP